MICSGVNFTLDFSYLLLGACFSVDGPSSCVRCNIEPTEGRTPMPPPRAAREGGAVGANFFWLLFLLRCKKSNEAPLAKGLGHIAQEVSGFSG